MIKHLWNWDAYVVPLTNVEQCLILGSAGTCILSSGILSVVRGIGGQEPRLAGSCRWADISLQRWFSPKTPPLYMLSVISLIVDAVSVFIYPWIKRNYGKSGSRVLQTALGRGRGQPRLNRRQVLYRHRRDFYKSGTKHSDYWWTESLCLLDVNCTPLSRAVRLGLLFEMCTCWGIGLHVRDCRRCAVWIATIISPRTMGMILWKMLKVQRKTLVGGREKQLESIKKTSRTYGGISYFFSSRKRNERGRDKEKEESTSQ